MREYNINILVDGEEYLSSWSGYTETVAIAQAMLYHAQNGARKIEIIDIYEKGKCMKCGNPNNMYWCIECEINTECSECEGCGNSTLRETDYHLNCN